ncbi:hypothetical protein DFQ69_11600 [Clostridioides difficile]|nr:hypothetical protein [Clostridioides difficile]
MHIVNIKLIKSIAEPIYIVTFTYHIVNIKSPKLAAFGLTVGIFTYHLVNIKLYFLSTIIT